LHAFFNFVGAKRLLLLNKGNIKYLYFSYHIFVRFTYLERTSLGQAATSNLGTKWL